MNEGPGDAQGPASVTEWLEMIGMSSYQAVFEEAGFRSLETVARLDESDLDALQSIKPGHCKKILICARQLAETLPRVEDKDQGGDAKPNSLPTSNDNDQVAENGEVDEEEMTSRSSRRRKEGEEEHRITTVEEIEETDKKYHTEQNIGSNDNEPELEDAGAK